MQWVGVIQGLWQESGGNEVKKGFWCIRERYKSEFPGKYPWQSTISEHVEGGDVPLPQSLPFVGEFVIYNRKCNYYVLINCIRHCVHSIGLI